MAIPMLRLVAAMTWLWVANLNEEIVGGAGDDDLQGGAGE